MENKYTIDLDAVIDRIKDVDDSSVAVQQMVDNIVKSYVGTLDNLMKGIYTKMTTVGDLTDTELERIYLELTNLVYFMGEKLESIGVKDDISRAAAKEVYNREYLDISALNASQIAAGSKTKLTVSEITAQAECAAVNEQVVNLVFARTYKQIKFKIDAAFEMINTLRKVISRRMQEQQLSATYDGSCGAPSRRVRLAE